MSKKRGVGTEPKPACTPLHQCRIPRHKNVQCRVYNIHQQKVQVCECVCRPLLQFFLFLNIGLSLHRHRTSLQVNIVLN